MIQWHVGCSGFYYKHWKEIFYPKGVPQRKWFEFYCQHFNTLELNVTFYRFPVPAMLHKWYNTSPPHFTFSVKAPRLITHYKKMNDCASLLSDFYGIVDEGLKEKTGCVLFQFPPRFAYSGERLDKIINSLNNAYPNVVEFRHDSWWNETVYKALKKNKISFSGMSHPDHPQTIITNTKLFYYRMHGISQLYKSLYSTEEIKELINTIQASNTVKKAFVYFNNDIDGSAIKNAKEMNDIISQTDAKPKNGLIGKETKN